MPSKFPGIPFVCFRVQRFASGPGKAGRCLALNIATPDLACNKEDYDFIFAKSASEKVPSYTVPSKALIVSLRPPWSAVSSFSSKNAYRHFSFEASLLFFEVPTRCLSQPTCVEIEVTKR